MVVVAMVELEVLVTTVVVVVVESAAATKLVISDSPAPESRTSPKATTPSTKPPPTIERVLKAKGDTGVRRVSRRTRYENDPRPGYRCRACEA